MDTIIAFPIDEQHELCPGFENRGFPQCVVAIDGTHILLIAPNKMSE